MNHLVKASVARHIVKLALDSRIEHLWLEGDSLNIINCILGITTPSWTIASIIEDLKSDLSKLKNFHVSHVYWEANPVADWFANEAVTRNTVMTWRSGNEISVVAIELIWKDQTQGTNIIPF